MSHAMRGGLSPAFLLFLFAGLCFAMAAVFGMDLDEQKFVLGQDEKRVPLSVPSDNSVYSIEVDQRTDNNSWVWVGIELENANNAYLMGFGSEMWHETGYDSDGRWVATQYETEVDITVPEAGEYFLVLKRQKPRGDNVGSAYVTVERELGSSVPFVAGGIIAILLGFVWNWFGSDDDDDDDDDD